MTEIFGTLGPACALADRLENMFLEGMTGMRLNLSHTGLKESEPLLKEFQKAARKAGIRPQLFIDLQGPEIRIGALPSPLPLRESDEVIFASESLPAPFPAPVIPVDQAILAAFEPGDFILLDDGKLELSVTSVQPSITARVLRGGMLCSRKSLKITGRQIPLPAITEHDKANIRLADDYGVTGLMQPFVTEGAQLLQLRKELRKAHMEHLRIFAKIENREGIRHIRDILPFADMIVIARGDLGNDMPLWELPAAQKTLSDLCRQEGKPFLVVTQLLASMEHSPRPTRAEVSDIFHAVMDGAAAVMVTNETAVGEYPVETIRYLKRTAQEAEKMISEQSRTAQLFYPC